jgi:hypothetical protein
MRRRCDLCPQSNTQTQPGVPVLRGNGSKSISDHRPLQAPRYDPRFRRQIEAIHALGPVVLGYLLEDIAAGKDLCSTVAGYAALPGEFIRAYGADRFPPVLRALDGGRP